MDDFQQFGSTPVVLVTCQEEALRRHIEAILIADGYDVLLARNSIEALLVGAEYQGRIHALITNIELGAFQNGVELASCFHLLRPEARILFTSTLKIPDHPIPLEVVNGNVSFLKTPFSGARLLASLETLLGEDGDLSAQAEPFLSLCI